MRFFAPLPFLAGTAALLWNAWWRDSSFGVAILFFWGSGLLLLASVAIVLAARNPRDKYWAFAALGLVIGFWLQR